MISCCELLEEYSDYRDGLMEDDRAARIESHLEVCASCASYHDVVVRGVRELRRLPDVEGSCDFLARLQHRIYHLEDEAAGWRDPYTSRASVGMVAALALLIGMAAWIPVVGSRTAVVELPPVAAAAPMPRSVVPSLFRSGPLLTQATPGGLTVAAENLFQPVSFRHAGRSEGSAFQRVDSAVPTSFTFLGSR